MDPKEKNDSDWQKELTPEEFQILRQKGTEKPFTGEYYDSKEKGMYACKACGNPLFDSDTKFDSGTGWPSFSDALNKESVDLNEDNSHFMNRTEVICKKCNSHLGHVFDDGPTPTGKRFCINSACLRLNKDQTS